MNTKVKPPRWVVGLAVIGTAIHVTTAADFFENFSEAPSASRWQTHGDHSLFQWNPAGHLDVTWDSSRTNSFFYHRLGTILGKTDDFRLSFQLRLKSVQSGYREGKTGTFELAIGLIKVADATHTNFFRGKGTGTVKNLFELDYFPDNGLGATIWPAAWSTNAMLSYRDSTDYTLVELPLNQPLRVELTYTATNRTLKTVIQADGQSIGPIHDLVLSPTFSDYRVDAFAICSYSDEPTSGSLLATGEIDDIALTIPPPPVEALEVTTTGSAWELQFISKTNWFYRAEATTAFETWEGVGSEIPGTGGLLSLPVTGPGEATFWRVRAARP